MTKLKRPERYVQFESIKPELKEITEFYTRKTADYQYKIKQLNEYVDALESEISVLKETPKVEVLLDNIPKNLPEVPRIVADFIKDKKESLKLYGAFYEIDKLNDGELYNWVFQKLNGQSLFARAWLDGYTVKKEQLYKVVFLNTSDDEILLLKSDAFFIDWISIYDDLKYRFTEQEIKSIDERYWQFAVPIYEVEP